MTEDKSPQTLAELLQAIERSRELRSLARECGLTVRELRRRLASWRRDLKGTPAGTAPAIAGLPATGPATRLPDDPPSPRTGRFPELPEAASLPTSPLPARGSRVLVAYTDGASRGNPGPAAVGVVFGQQDGPELCVHAEAIGRATNNQAEYRAVLAALEHCERWGLPRLHLFVDSELVARQLMGVYRVKSPDLLPLYQQAVHLARRRQEFLIRHVPRAQNAHADHLANLALDAAERAGSAQRR